MKDQEVNSSQLESVLSWSKEFHELKSIGGTWHHQANHIDAQVVAQRPNAVQLSIMVRRGMMGIIGGLVWIYHSKFSSSMRRNP
jgi:hypothetical protein